MDQAYAFHTHKAERWTEAQKPVNGDLVLDVELILLEGSVVPGAHDNHENKGESYWNPCTFKKLDEGSREEEHLYGSKERNKAYSKENALVPAEDDYEGHQAGGDQHNDDDG